MQVITIAKLKEKLAFYLEERAKLQANLDQADIAINQAQAARKQLENNLNAFNGALEAIRGIIAELEAAKQKPIAPPAAAAAESVK